MNENIAKSVLWKAQDLSKSPHKNWCSVVKIINKINSYLDGRIKLNQKQIAYQIDKLTYYTIGIPVSIPLTSNTTFSRARICDLQDGNKFHTEVTELSYINKDAGKHIHQERLNSEGKALFYASLGTYYETINAVLSEVRANPGEVFNILVSGTKAADSGDRLESFLHIIPIGVLDYYRKGVPTPYNLHDSYREIYKLLSDNTSKKSIRSVHLCDEFLTDLLKRPKTTRLYDVTSAIGSEFLKNDMVDGILYPSTCYASFPNVAIKPTSVEKKIQYHAAIAVEVVLIDEHGIYHIRKLDDGLVNGNQILWAQEIIEIINS